MIKIWNSSKKNDLILDPILSKDEHKKEVERIFENNCDNYHYFNEIEYPHKEEKLDDKSARDDEKIFPILKESICTPMDKKSKANISI